MGLGQLLLLPRRSSSSSDACSVRWMQKGAALTGRAMPSGEAGCERTAQTSHSSASGQGSRLFEPSKNASLVPSRRPLWLWRRRWEMDRITAGEGRMYICWASNMRKYGPFLLDIVEDPK